MTLTIEGPTHLANQVHAEPGSVTSRVLLRNAGGVMTVFAFAEGEGLSEHSTPHDATLLILEGALEITVGNVNHRVETGELLHLPAGVPHTLHGGGAFKMLLTLLKDRVD